MRFMRRLLPRPPTTLAALAALALLVPARPAPAQGPGRYYYETYGYGYNPGYYARHCPPPAPGASFPSSAGADLKTSPWASARSSYWCSGPDSTPPGHKAAAAPVRWTVRIEAAAP
jgi:hypothetical protein